MRPAYHVVGDVGRVGDKLDLPKVRGPEDLELTSLSQVKRSSLQTCCELMRILGFQLFTSPPPPNSQNLARTPLFLGTVPDFRTVPDRSK